MSILKSIFLTFVLLIGSYAYAIPAPYFGTDTAAGETQFRADVNAANNSAEFFEKHFTSSTLASSLQPFSVTGSEGTVMYVKVSRGGTVQAYNDSVTHSHDGNGTYYMDTYSVSTGGSWATAVANGVKFEFFSDALMQTPATLNAFGTFTYDWGTCCTGSNVTPTGTETGTAVYAVFEDANGNTSTNRIGNITSNIGSDVHFVAEIDDSNSFTSVTLVPNGSGEAFGIGGYVLFSQVGVGTVEGGGWTPSVPPSATISPSDGSTSISPSSSISITFSEAVRNLDDTELTDSNVDSLITLKDTNSSGSNIPFDATINASKTVITINPTNEFSASQQVYVAIGATVEDSDNNAASPTNSTFTVAAAGIPSGSISPQDGSSGVSTSSNISITYTEAMRIISGDTTITDSNIDALITLKQNNSSGADIPFDATISSDKTTITIAPTSNFSTNQVIYVAIGATLEDLSNNQASAISSTFTTSSVSSVSSISTPLNKSDVVGSVSAWSNASSKWSSIVAKGVSNRISWLSRNNNTLNTSHQGIKIHFEDEIINAIMNASVVNNNRSTNSIGLSSGLSGSSQDATLVPQSEANESNSVEQYREPQSTEGSTTTLLRYLSMGSASDNSTVSLDAEYSHSSVVSSEQIKSDIQAAAINEAARLRHDVIGSLNPTFKPVYEDWSMWTAGQITVGEVGATTSASKQDSKDVAISLGFDKPFYDDGLVGWSLSLGQSKTDIGTSTTEVKSDNVALSGYSVIKQDNGNTIESILGLGHLKFDTTRIDGSDTLTGKRDANQVFASVTIKNNKATVEKDNWSITPYGKASASYTELDKFSEAGASTALTFYKQTVNEAKVYIGADATYLVTLNNGTMTPFAKIEYGRDISGGSKATMHYNSETTEYTLNLDKAAEEHWKLGIGTDIQTKDGWTGSFGYEREQAVGSGHSDSLKLDAKLKF